MLNLSISTDDPQRKPTLHRSTRDCGSGEIGGHPGLHRDHLGDRYSITSLALCRIDGGIVMSKA